MISQWSDEKSLEPAFAALADAVAAGSSGIILDIRGNGGGDEPLAKSFADCFVSTAKPYAKNRIRDAGQWSGPFEHVIEPTPDRPKFRGKVAVLIGPGDMSTSESFALMMKCADGCKLIGQRTGGSSGNPKPNDLGNGVIAYLATWDDMLLDGTHIEGAGVPPDIEVRFDPAANGPSDSGDRRGASLGEVAAAIAQARSSALRNRRCDTCCCGGAPLSEASGAATRTSPPSTMCRPGLLTTCSSPFRPVAISTSVP